VSKQAADLLGFKQNGTARVRVQYEGRGKVADPAQSADIDGSPATSTTAAAPVTSVAATELAPPAGARGAAPVAAAATTAPVPSSSPLDAAWGEPDGTVTSQPVPASTRLWIQVGSFTIRSNAERLATSLTRLGAAQTSQIMLNGRPMFRVRFGPFNAVDEADAMLDRVINAGQNGAQIVVE
jgi:rare lipoprotein A